MFANDIHTIFLVYGFRNLQQMTKITFSSLLFVLEFRVRNITAFYSGCWYIATQTSCHCHFNKRAALNWFLCAINARNLSWAGMEQEGHPEWVRSLWEPVSRKRGMASPAIAWCNTNRQLSYNEKKRVHLLRWFWHFLRRLFRTRTHDEMVIST